MCVRVCVCLLVYVCMIMNHLRLCRCCCISPGLGEQTDTDTPVAHKSALLPKPNDVKKWCVCVCLCVCNPYDSSVRNEGEAHQYKYTHKYACVHSDTGGELMHTKCTVCRRKIRLQGNKSNNLISTLLKINC